MGSTRRSFLEAAGLTIVGSRLVRGTEANSAVRVGLLGCGGRGTTVATSMVKNAGARVVALGEDVVFSLGVARGNVQPRHLNDVQELRNRIVSVSTL